MNLTCLDPLLAWLSPQQRNQLSGRALAAVESVKTLPRNEHAQNFQEMLESIAAYVCGDPIGQAYGGSEDHDYEGFFKLARSVAFAWGHRSSLKRALAVSPQSWALARLLARLDMSKGPNILEVGAGTGSLAYELGCVNSQTRLQLLDPSIGSLVLAQLIYSGQKLTLPMRCSPDHDPSGIQWYSIQVPALQCSFETIPDINSRGGDFDAIVAVNALSLAPDPRQAVRLLSTRLRAGGWFVWVDLVCWRVETPELRRLQGRSQMVDILLEQGLEVIEDFGGIPYIEDWGFERSYHWTSHLVLAKRPEA